MARKLAEAVLSMLCLAAPAAWGADDFVPGGLDDVRKAMSELSLRMQQEQTAHKARETLLDADLMPTGLEKQGWKDEHLTALAKAIRLGGEAVRSLHQEHAGEVSGPCACPAPAPGEQACRAFGRGRFDRGGRAHQEAAYSGLSALRAVPWSALEVRKIVLGKGIEHRAILVHPKGMDWRMTGVVLDAWPCQSHLPQKMTYTLELWQAKLSSLSYREFERNVFQSGPRLED